MSEILADELHPLFRGGICALSGPSVARDHRRQAGIHRHSLDERRRRSQGAAYHQLQPLSRYTNEDIVGVEFGGALKNIIALAAGVCDGMNYGDNAKATIITRGLAEIGRLAEARRQSAHSGGPRGHGRSDRNLFEYAQPKPLLRQAPGIRRVAGFHTRIHGQCRRGRGHHTGSGPRRRQAGRRVAHSRGDAQGSIPKRTHRAGREQPAGAPRPALSRRLASRSVRPEPIEGLERRSIGSPKHVLRLSKCSP